jgi:hypothetical protein
MHEVVLNGSTDCTYTVPKMMKLVCHGPSSFLKMLCIYTVQTLYIICTYRVHTLYIPNTVKVYTVYMSVQNYESCTYTIFTFEL